MGNLNSLLIIRFSIKSVKLTIWGDDDYGFCFLLFFIIFLTKNHNNITMKL